LRELRKGDTPEIGKAFSIARGMRLQGPFASIGRSAGRISNLRSIPPRTSTAIGGGFSSKGASRGLSRRQYGATFAGGNHSRPTLTDRGPSTPFVPEIVEPLVDVFNEGDCILVIAEVPGAEEASISVELENHTLKLQAGGRYRAYRGEVGLPADIEHDGLAWTLNNGIIELRLKRKKSKRKATNSRAA
jgi:HSP20 family molecular chaperone IbpA